MKTRLKRPRDSLGEIPTKIKSEKISCWNLSADSDCCRSTGPVDRQRSEIRPLGKRSTGWSTVKPKQRVILSVGRPLRSTGKNKEHCSCSRSTGRSTDVHTCTVVHVGRPPGRPTEQFCSASGRPCGRPD